MIKIDKKNSYEISVKHLVPRGKYCNWEVPIEYGLTTFELCPLLDTHMNGSCKAFNQPLDEEQSKRGAETVIRAIKCRECLDAEVGSSRILAVNGANVSVSDAETLASLDRELE